MPQNSPDDCFTGTNATIFSLDVDEYTDFYFKEYIWSFLICPQLLPITCLIIPCEQRNIRDRAEAIRIGVTNTHLIYCKEKIPTCWRLSCCDEGKVVREIPLQKITDVIVTEDGHAKLLTTWRPTLVELAKHGQPSDTLGIAMAAWIRFTASETRAPTLSAPTVCAPTVGAHEPTLEAAAAALRLDSSHATVATFLRRYVGGDILINHESETPSGLVGRISDALMVMNHDDPEMMANAVRALLTSSQGWCSMAPL